MPLTLENALVRRVFALPVAVVIAGAVGVLAAQGGRLTKPLTAADATRAYERWIFRHYAGPQGHWVCPVGDPFAKAPGGVSCHAEFFGPGKWHILDTRAWIKGRSIRFVTHDSLAWTRHWRAVPKQILGGNGATGTATVNTPLDAHDWSWLASSAAAQWSAKINRSTRVNSDGPLAFDYWVFERFTCVLSTDLVTCTTPFGDSMRYRP
jgi:hypothetical protein